MAFRSSEQAVAASAASLACNTPAGTASGDRLVAFIGDDAVGSITPNPAGDWQVIRDVGGAGVSSQVAGYYLDLVAAPAASYTFDSAGGATNIEVVLVALDPGADTFGALTSSTVGEAVTATVSNPAVDGAADPSTILFCSVNDATATVVTPPASMTLAEFADNASHDTAVYYQENAGAASITKSIEWSTATGKLTFLVVQAMTTAAGPTIDTQPQNATVTAPAQAQFTAAATSSGGTLLRQWQEDDGGGFANLSNVSPYSGVTTDTLTIDPTATGLDGFDYRCVYTDDNGSTNTDAATLTVNAGPLLDPNPMAATDAGGDATSDLTSDVPLDTVDGQYLELSTTIDGVTLRCAVLPSTP